MKLADVGYFYYRAHILLSNPFFTFSDSPTFDRDISVDKVVVDNSIALAPLLVVHDPGALTNHAEQCVFVRFGIKLGLGAALLDLGGTITSPTSTASTASTSVYSHTHMCVKIAVYINYHCSFKGRT